MYVVKIYVILFKNWSINWYKLFGLIKIYIKKCYGINIVLYISIYINLFKIVFINYCICIFYIFIYLLEY